MSGLPPDYIRREVAAFRSSGRKAAAPEWGPLRAMSMVAANASDRDVAAAARYFASIPLHDHSGSWKPDGSQAPRRKDSFCWKFRGKVNCWATGLSRRHRISSGATPGWSIPPTSRLDPSRMTPRWRKPRGAGLTTPCATCHGAELRGITGAAAPPIAGRSPSYLFRQPYGFRTGARGGDTAQPMHQVVARLTQKDMISLAAYAGSLKP